ncbi:MAG: PEP-CTERM sorting domain-containing protein [Rhodospirillaceae bacterium]|jgi:hypothetical protein|nr:PEP-CTERM sorting domain-containing protein [Rhodospirillaceae bacterium]MBT5459466.1 PEP-CTERM sorting domain-containing protein [Rhodospirillaceae bacterium]
METFKSLTAGGCFALLAVVATNANAAIIHDNGVSLTQQGANFSQVGGVSIVADDFSVGASDTIRSTQFWGTHWSSGVLPANDSFTVTIYGDTGGAPNSGNIVGTSALSLVSRIDTGFNHNNVSSADILEYIMNLVTPVLLPSAGTYWFSVVHAAVPGNATKFAWDRVSNGSPNPYHTSANSGATWVPSIFDVSYNISNNFVSTIPEPDTLAILGLGLAGLGFARRRKAA